MSDNKAFVIVIVCFLIFLVAMGGLHHLKDSKEEVKELSDQLANRSDTLVRIINSQKDIQKYVLELKSEVDSLKIVHKKCK